MVRKALGKGLDAILPITPGEEKAESVANEVPVSMIDPNPDQPRHRMNAKALSELAQSIREKGIIQPLVVRQTGERYQLIAGERRLRAAEMAGLNTVPVVIKDSSPNDLLILALIENIQREDLNPLEEARAYESLIKQHNLTQEQISLSVGKERSTVANSLRLLNLPAYAMEALGEGKISSGHARALLMLSEIPIKMKNCFKQIMEKSLSVREAEKLVKKLKEPPPERKIGKEETVENPFLKDAQRRLSNNLSAKVLIKQKHSGQGQIQINFSSEEELNRLFDLLISVRY